MVLKLRKKFLKFRDMFENSVNMYGTQTLVTEAIEILQFENSVNMYGTQTENLNISCSTSV